MLLYAVALTLVTLLYILFIYLSWNENYWIKRKIPFVEPVKIFGNVKDVIFMRRTIGEVYQDIYSKLRGKPLGGFFKMRQPILMIRDPDLVSEVLDKKFSCFHDNDIVIRRDADPILKMNPFLAKGSQWEARREVLVPLQQNELLEGMLQTIKPVCKEMVQFLIKNDLPVEVKELCTKFTTDAISSCALGWEVNSFKNSDEKFRYMSEKLMRKNVRSNAALLLALYAPIMGNWFNFRIVSKSLSNYFIGLVSANCKFRVKEGIRKKDFLQRLIDINKESEASGEGTAYNYNSIAGHCMSLFLNGVKMTSHPLSFCLYEIAMHPDAQKKIRQEIEANGIKSVDELSNYLIHGLEYLDMVVKESLRLHPPIETITRVCTVKTELVQKDHCYPVDEGVPVTVPVKALHMDPAYYPEPELFKPERFDKEASNARHPSVYLPFGAGPRVCPGNKLALLILKAAIVAILLELEVVPRGNIKNLEHEPTSSLIAEPKHDIWLRFKKPVTFY